MTAPKQLPLDYEPAARAPFEGTSATSAQAAEDIKPHLGPLEQLVYNTIARQENRGATDDEVECLTGLRHQTASARRRALVLNGMIKDSGQTRATRSGRRAVVWVPASMATPFDATVGAD